MQRDVLSRIGPVWLERCKFFFFFNHNRSLTSCKSFIFFCCPICAAPNRLASHLNLVANCKNEDDWKIWTCMENLRSLEQSPSFSCILSLEHLLDTRSISSMDCIPSFDSGACWVLTAITHPVESRIADLKWRSPGCGKLKIGHGAGASLSWMIFVHLISARAVSQTVIF